MSRFLLVSSQLSNYLILTVTATYRRLQTVAEQIRV